MGSYGIKIITLVKYKILKMQFFKKVNTETTIYLKYSKYTEEYVSEI